VLGDLSGLRRQLPERSSNDVARRARHCVLPFPLRTVRLEIAL
jgi:hypothetical protein